MKVFVVGYMASGKSTFGKALADKLDTLFIDLDKYIENQTGKSIQEIFLTEGEEHFRKLEKEMLYKAVEENPDAVISCGGGTPCFFDNMNFINDQGISVFMETSIPVLISRLVEESESRPLIAGKTEDVIRQMVLSQLCDRLPVYMEAKLKWSGDDLNTEKEIDDNVCSFISSYPSIFR